MGLYLQQSKNTNNIGLIPGVNVISPTWFSITNEHGNIVDKGIRTMPINI